MRSGTLIAAAALLGLLASLPLNLARAQQSGNSSILKVNQIKPGMKGHGLTVFSGTKPERFDIEVIDVLKDFLPRQELILIKTFHPRLEVAKVVAGMSGSPIFIDGKMIGAYAYGWSFGKEPVAGVTPIENMIAELNLPLPDSINGWPLKMVPGTKSQKAAAPKAASDGKLGQRFHGDPGKYDVRTHAKQLASVQGTLGGSSGAQIRPVATPLMMSGMTPAAVEFSHELLAPLGLEPLQAGGGGKTPEPGAPTRYEDGGAIGVRMIRGDMNAMGLGTVTRVEGDKLVAFGHPMMQAGVTAMPTAIGRVLWFMASEQRSFKIGMPVRDVGALVNDRVASIVVSHSIQAPIVPVTMTIKGVRGQPTSVWKFEVAQEKFMTPTFMAVALGSALQAIASEREDITWTAKSKLKVKGQPEIELDDFGVAIGGTPEPGEFVRSNLVRAAGAVLNNPWQNAFLESASMEMEVRYARDIVRLRGAELLETEIDAGQPARIRLTLVPWSGPEQSKVITVPLPEHLAGRSVTIELGPGYTEEREKAAPNNLAELIKNFENPIFPPRSVIASFGSGDAGLAFNGKVANNLPPGALDLLRPTTSSIGPDAFQTSIRHVVPLSEFMIGRDRVTVTIRPVLR
ncbi:MAG TPA: SpoIVB peptidase S55 domain-containing protein [Polyangiaceae bacterium]|nr:SpoIVB peptidase S55 domain-containing protein [Polyangiaceae bacterium]